MQPQDLTRILAYEVFLEGLNTTQCKPELSPIVCVKVGNSGETREESNKEGLVRLEGSFD
jgi:hypothetical protein